LLTEAQMRAEAHDRAERGTSCYQSGRCRLPNAYLYDKEIVPRVVKSIRSDGRFARSSIWVEGRRRWVWLKGCVDDPALIPALEQLVRGIDDVEAVIAQLQVGTSTPVSPYRGPAR
jgi:osmotically-inducible protein OsmY